MERILERDDDLALLEQAVAAGGGGRFILLAGEAGIGKSTLVGALRERIGEGASFLVAHCEALSVPAPLAPIRELAEAAGTGELPATELSDRLRLATRLLAALAAQAPVVAVVEDAHWADAATLDVLRLLARRIAGHRVSLVVTYRQDEVGANAELERLLGDLATGSAVQRVVLRPLSDAAVRELAPSNLDAARLSRLTGGNPFLVVESIAAGGELPASVRDATLARAGRLSPAARDAVAAAAVIGARVPPRLLDAVAPGSAAGVDEALAFGVLVADDALLGFRHELLRAAVEASLSPSRRAELHARVAEALVAHAPVDHARVAHHAELAGLDGEAARHAMLAAAEAERLGALLETSRQAERALRLGALPDGERLELLLRHARAANFASPRLEDAVESAREAIALAERLGDRVRQARAETALAAASWSLDRVADARAAAERSVALLESVGDAAALARALAALTRIEATMFDPNGALATGARALELAQDEETRLAVAISLGLARGHLGDRESIDALLAAIAAARSSGFTIQTVRAYFNATFVAATLRRHDVVEPLAAEALQQLDEYQTRIPADAIESCLARSRFDRGRWDDALAIVMRAGRNPGSERPMGMTFAGLVAARRGDHDGAAQLLQAAWSEIEALPESSRHGAVRAALVEAAWLRGDDAEALRLLHAARESEATLRFARSGGELALWSWRYGVDLAPPANAPDPIALELAGDWRGAVRAWGELEAPYEAALAALRGNERAARAAVAELQRMGAAAAARAFARDREAAGARSLRGPRRSTRSHPAGLTRREQEVLEQLATGATNPAIASALHVSEHTVAHHVSAILRKLGADTRLGAVELARAQRLLPQDSQAGAQR